MKDLRLWIFVGLLVILAVQVIGCAPAPGTMYAKQTGPTTEVSRGNWTYIPINRDKFDPEADLDVVSRWSDNNLRRELIAFQFVFSQNSYGNIVSTFGVYIYSRLARP